MDRSIRQNKLAALLQGVIGRFLSVEGREWGIGRLVVVDRVLVSPDLRNADVWLSFSPYDKKTAQRDFEVVGRHLREIQEFVFGQLALHRAPKLHLYASDTEQLFKIMDIFDTIKDHDRNISEDSGEAAEGEEDPTSNP